MTAPSGGSIDCCLLLFVHRQLIVQPEICYICKKNQEFNPISFKAFEAPLTAFMSHLEDTKSQLLWGNSCRFLSSQESYFSVCKLMISGDFNYDLNAMTPLPHVNHLILLALDVQRCDSAFNYKPPNACLNEAFNCQSYFEICVGFRCIQYL